MADSMIQSGRDIASRYSTYATTGDRDIYTNPADVEKENALYKDKGTLSFTDMLGLMVTQFQNQTIDNQASTTDMMNQLVQMSSMQAMNEMTSNMKELALANVMSYSASLVDKYVTLGVYDDEGELQEIYGKVEGAGTYDGQQVIFVDGKSYFLSSIMAVGKLPPTEKPEDPDKPVDPDNPVDPDKPVDPENPDSGTEDNGGTDAASYNVNGTWGI